MKHFTNYKEIRNKFDKVFIHQESLDSPVAKRVQLVFEKNNIEIVTSPPKVSNSLGQMSAEEFNNSKRLLYITPYQGKFFKRCPGAKPGLACCNYFILNLGQQCDMNCSYCYLQSFLNFPFLTIYSNIENGIAELKQFHEENPSMKLRIGTGEQIDSLSLDDLTLYSVPLIEFFREVPDWRLELKTKSKKVEQFINVPHKDNVIVSWSLNPQPIIDSEEHGTASLVERLSAARKAKDKGFLIAFHLDPLIWHPQWKENYSEMIEIISSFFKPNEVLSISLGALRFQPEQRHIMRERFGLNSYVTSAEMFRGEDGKYRYDIGIRKQMFDHLLFELKSRGNWNAFLCMETRESWMNSQLGSPKSNKGLDDYFDHRPVAAFNKNISN